jgi:VWFA-related protein
MARLHPANGEGDEVTRAAVLPIFVAAIAAAQQDTPSPTFRAGTKLVEVDVVARSNGAPATGLTKDDFTLLDNGKPQKIAFFSAQSGRVAAPPVVGVAPLPAGEVSNRAERADRQDNTVVVFLDQRNTPPPEQAFAIRRIAKFIGTRSPQDRTGIYTFGRDGSLKVVQETTSDSELLSRAAASLKWQDPDFRSPDVSGLEGNGGHSAADEFTALLIRTREIDTKQVLELAARHLANVPGRKSLIWISAAFPLHWNYLDFTPDMLEAARQLNDAGVALYAVDPRGVAGALSGQTHIAPAEYGGVHTQEQIQALMIGEGRFPSALRPRHDGLAVRYDGRPDVRKRQRHREADSGRCGRRRVYLHTGILSGAGRSRRSTAQPEGLGVETGYWPSLPAKLRCFARGHREW